MGIDQNLLVKKIIHVIALNGDVDIILQIICILIMLMSLQFMQWNI